MTRAFAPALAGYQRAWLRPDLVAGLTVWAVLVPESLAYATIAGVPPVVGLYAAVPALLLYAVVGSSRHLVVAPMSATAALSAGVVAEVATGSAAGVAALTAAVALATGLLALLAGVLRLGFLASFISEPVLKGFIVGLALTIMIGQLPDLLGIGKGSGSFFEKLGHILGELGEVDGLTAVVGLGSLAALLALRRWLPLLPGSLVVALAGIALAAAFDLDQHGVALVGHIDAGLPHLGLPDVSRSDLGAVLGGAAGVMLVGFAEGLGAAKTYAARSGYDVDPNRELLGLGAANLGAGLCSGMVVNGSLSKTAVNGASGARSQMSPVTAAVLTVATLLFLTGLFEKLPEATLAAVVIAAVVELVDVGSLRRLWRVRTGRITRVYQVSARADFAAAVAALLGVLLFDTLPGLVIGVAVSLLLLVARTSRPHVAVLAPVSRLPDGGTGAPEAARSRRPAPGTAWVDVERNPRYSTVPGLLVVRVEGPLVFSNADFVRTRVRELAAGVPHLRLVVLDGRTTPSIDVTAVQMLTELRADLARDGADLALADDVGQVRDVLRRAAPSVGSGPDDGEPALHATVDDAIASLAWTQLPATVAGTGPSADPGPGA